MTTSTTNSSTSVSFGLHSIFNREKLNGTNFMEWYQNIRIVLRHDKKMYVPETPFPDTLASNASKAVKDAWAKHVDDSSCVSCLMLASMEPNPQHDLEYLKSYEMIEELKVMFQ